MPVRISHHGEVTHHTTGIYRRLHEDVLLPRLFDDPINFFPTVALEPEMIETRLNFILHDDQNEHWIYSLVSSRTEPDIMTAFKAAVPHNRKSAERRVELN